ncbi:hypothetical protein [Nostoc favosum]|uniref:CopG domain protein DNA-binding domain protein n=1 Tax=Nostoc favosum CHAB5714 TaxID=2780399 RepID=A0ABS8IIN9_9NOSO|nr:hypothetical protein [Nostoc favosum]MCC5603676.1 hypothetical protein [Nostoc favosum CHAB5714]
MTNKKRLRNIPILHSEVKKRHQIVVTPTAWKNMNQVATERGISISELIEEFGRRLKSPAAYPHK